MSNWIVVWYDRVRENKTGSLAAPYIQAPKKQVLEWLKNLEEGELGLDLMDRLRPSHASRAWIDASLIPEEGCMMAFIVSQCTDKSHLPLESKIVERPVMPYKQPQMRPKPMDILYNKTVWAGKQDEKKAAPQFEGLLRSPTIDTQVFNSIENSNANTRVAKRLRSARQADGTSSRKNRKCPELAGQEDKPSFRLREVSQAMVNPRTTKDINKYNRNYGNSYSNNYKNDESCNVYKILNLNAVQNEGHQGPVPSLSTNDLSEAPSTCNPNDITLNTVH